MIDILSIVICILTYSKLKNTDEIQPKKLEIINTVGLILLVLFRIIFILSLPLFPIFILTTIILSIFYIINIKKLRSLNKVLETVVYCPKCGISVKGDSVFCPDCGEKIS